MTDEAVGRMKTVMEIAFTAATDGREGRMVGEKATGSKSRLDEQGVVRGQTKLLSEKTGSGSGKGRSAGRSLAVPESELFHWPIVRLGAEPQQSDHAGMCFGPGGVGTSQQVVESR